MLHASSLFASAPPTLWRLQKALEDVRAVSERIETLGGFPNQLISAFSSRRSALRPDRGASRLSPGPDPAHAGHYAARNKGAVDRQLRRALCGLRAMAFLRSLRGRYRGADNGALAELVVGPVVTALQALRGVALAVAAGVMAEIGDIRRFDNPRQLMAYLGLVPGERSSGEKRRPTSITKAGSIVARKLIVEAAWAYRMPAKVGQGMQRRHEGPPRENPLHRMEGASPTLRAISANAGETEEGADRAHRRCPGTRRVHLGDRLLGLADESYWLIGRQGKRGRRGDGQGVGAGWGNPPPKIGSGNSDLRGSDRGSPTTHIWHAVANPRIRNCSTVAKAPAP